ncbi:DUF4303 domain-containing protein [Chitinimonas prasina]|nr:DUF4303 domain-containing protein [Chitinimonas prasina]
MDFHLLQLMIENAAKQAFDGVRLRYPDQKFCGYALYSDPDAITICPAVNSLENLEKLVAGDPGDAVYYRWSPGEWDHEFEGAEHFQDICRILQEEARCSHSTEARKRLKEEIYEACVLALENMKIQGYFYTGNDPIAVVFTVRGGETQSEIDWIGKLNTSESLNEFIRWSDPNT